MKKGIENMNKNTKKNIFYKTNPRGGISLIVLVITIIVVIILAAAVIISLQNNNPMVEANKARINSDVANMQAIFTNTVGKIMADKQEAIGIIPGSLNDPIKNVKSVVGEAMYTINDKISGRIIFDELDNNNVDYYTGRRLPVYNDETIWYVDSQGILRLQIGEDVYGEGKIEEEKLDDNIKITSSVTVNSNFSKATIGVIIEYKGEIESVRINGENVEVVRNAEGKYIFSKEVSDNGNYKVVVISKDGTLNKINIQVDKLADNMEIWNSEDMEKFRTKVNSGATFVDKKVQLMEDIYLGCSSSNQWVPINNFAGTFEGNNHKIDELYIDVVGTGKRNQGLFSTNNGNIQNVEVEGYVKGNEGNIALVCGINNGKLKNVTTSGEVLGWNQIGGCAGANNGTIEGCINKAKVGPCGTTGYYGRAVGGIVGISNKGNLTRCTNQGKISGNHGVGGIVGDGQGGEIDLCINNGTITGLSSETKYNAIYVGGIAGVTAYQSKQITKNCLNSGEVKSSIGGSNCGGIVGYIAGSKTGHAIIQNCYNIGTISGYNRMGIVAKEGFSSSAIGTRELINNYFLQDCGVTYGRPGSNSNAEPKTQAQIDELIKNIPF